MFDVFAKSSVSRSGRRIPKDVELLLRRATRKEMDIWPEPRMKHGSTRIRVEEGSIIAKTQKKWQGNLRAGEFSLTQNSPPGSSRSFCGFTFCYLIPWVRKMVGVAPTGGLQSRVALFTAIHFDRKMPMAHVVEADRVNRLGNVTFGLLPRSG